MNFASDNVVGAAPEILAALIEANQGAAMPYGGDADTQRVCSRLSEVFETEVTVFPVATGSAANALALSVLSPPFGAIYCHTDAHINIDECGAPEFYTGGAKLVTLEGRHGKLPAADLASRLAQAGVGVVHHVQPAAVSITQATEAGTVYSIAEIKAIAQVAQAHQLPLHMDGARFANALVRLGCTPAEMTWKAGVDVLSFGATKNGAIAAEAVIFFKPELVKSFSYRRKRGGHLFSKMRFLSAQLEAYLQDELWLRLATHANQMADRLSQRLAELPGVTLAHPVEANEIFAYLPEAMIAGLLAEGFYFYRWTASEAGTLVRLVTAFNTKEEDVEAFLNVAQRYARTDSSSVPVLVTA
jgi:threonine aldolase